MPQQSEGARNNNNNNIGERIDDAVNFRYRRRTERMSLRTRGRPPYLTIHSIAVSAIGTVLFIINP